MSAMAIPRFPSIRAIAFLPVRCPDREFEVSPSGDSPQPFRLARCGWSFLRDDDSARLVQGNDEVQEIR
jgi:hypothetical protein